MRTIDKIRSTNDFHILSGRVQELGVIAQHFGKTLVSVAFNSKTEEYTARVSSEHRMDDVRFIMNPIGKVQILERVNIIDFDEVRRYSERQQEQRP